MTCIQRYEPSIFVEGFSIFYELLIEDPKLGFTDFRVKAAPCGSLCVREIMRSYKNVGHTDAIIKNSRWQATIHSLYSELKDKHSDSDAIQLFTKDLSLQFDDVQSTMEAYSFSDLAGIQTLMVILATYESEHQVKTWVSNYFEKSLDKPVALGNQGSLYLRDVVKELQGVALRMAAETTAHDLNVTKGKRGGKRERPSGGAELVAAATDAKKHMLQSGNALVVVVISAQDSITSP